MKALSIRQPWTWCVLYAGKLVENRDWTEGGPNIPAARRLLNTEILLHAAKGMTRAEYEDCLATVRTISRKHYFPPGLTMPSSSELPRGGIVGTARLVAIVNDECAEEYGDISVGDHARNSPWFFGRVGLVLADAKPTKFIPFKGSLGFFDVPDEIVREAMAG